MKDYSFIIRSYCRGTFLQNIWRHLKVALSMNIHSKCKFSNSFKPSCANYSTCTVLYVYLSLFLFLSNPSWWNGFSFFDTVSITGIQPHAFEDLTWEEELRIRILKDFPRASIRHFYLPYKSDLHLPNAFRHHMELKDDIFPKHWQNKQSAK